MTDDERVQIITDMLLLVRDNLFGGMSKSAQKLQARSINEVLGLPTYTSGNSEYCRAINDAIDVAALHGASIEIESALRKLGVSK